MAVAEREEDIRAQLERRIVRPRNFPLDEEVEIKLDGK
jgi:hypothetical protein